MSGNIKNLTFVLTYSCNLKCKHCDIWENGKNDFISLSVFQKITNEKVLKESYYFYNENFDISFSWGEVFLIKNFDEYFYHVRDKYPNAKYCITTNGILMPQILKFLSGVHWKYGNFQNLKLNISIDWPDNIHNLQRWVSGAFHTTINTILNIKKMFPTLLMEIKFTITPINYWYIRSFTLLAAKLGIFFSFKPYEFVMNYMNKKHNLDVQFSEKQIKIIEYQISENPFILQQNNYKNKNFYNKIPSYLRNGLSKEEKARCQIANDDIIIMPDLDVFSCIFMKKLWTLKKENLSNIWHGKLVNKQRDIIKSGECQGCMLMCWWAKTDAIFE